jgi:hypothetical protein
MGVKPVLRVVIRDFAGLETNADPNDIEPGKAREQINIVAERSGELRPRQGWARVKFQSP